MRQCSLRCWIISLSLLRHNRPVRLLRQLEIDGQLKKYTDGIYYEKRIYFSTQLIVTSELTPEERPYLNYLSNNLNMDQAKNLVFYAEREKSHLGKELVDALLHVVVRTNNEVFEIGKKEDDKMCEALRELMAPEIKEAADKAAADATKKAFASAHNTAINNLSDTLMKNDPSLSKEAAVVKAKEWLKLE